MAAVTPRDWQVWSVWLLLGATCIKAVIAASFPLGVDEAYAIAAAREVSLSFFDHPPLGFWAPVASAHLFGETALAYRAPFLACGALSGWLLFLTGRALGGARVGALTLILFILAPHMALGSGAFVLPDAPLNLGGAVVAYALTRMAGQDHPPLRLWLLGGLGLAIAFASKYQSGLIPFGVLSFMFLTPGRWRWALQPGFWGAALISLIGVAPVILWNLQEDWISFAFHGARTERSLQPGNFAAMFAGQLAYVLPATFGVAIWAAIRALRAEAPSRVLAHLALWPILVFNGIYLFSNASFPHWTMPGFVFALPLVASWWDQRAGRWFTWVTAASAALLWGIAAILLLHVPTGVLAPKQGFAELDRTEEVFDWSGLAPALTLTAGYDGSQIIVVDSWIEAGQIGTGLAMGGATPRLFVRHTPHHFALTQDPDLSGPALYLVPDRLDRLDPGASLAVAQALDPQAKPMGQIALNRGSQPYAGVTVTALTLP